MNTINTEGIFNLVASGDVCLNLSSLNVLVPLYTNLILGEYQLFTSNKSKIGISKSLALLTLAPDDVTTNSPDFGTVISFFSPFFKTI